MEKIEWLIDKLKRQYDATAGAAAMLNTLQLLQQELVAQTTAAPAVQRVTVVMPAPQWNTHAADELDAYETENLRSEDEQKVVFELEPYIEEDEPEEEIAMMDEVEEQKPAVEAESPSPSHSPYLPEENKTDSPAIYLPEAEPVTIVPIPSIQAIVMPNPAPETDKKSLNDLHESPLPEVYNRYHEPIKDLKKAISINDRYQYINSLFGGDENAYDKSIKTINHFNIFSEAEYWMRRELSVKYGWEESDRQVQQFYDLVSRRFA